MKEIKWHLYKLTVHPVLSAPFSIFSEPLVCIVPKPWQNPASLEKFRNGILLIPLSFNDIYGENGKTRASLFINVLRRIPVMKKNSINDLILGVYSALNNIAVDLENFTNIFARRPQNFIFKILSKFSITNLLFNIF